MRSTFKVLFFLKRDKQKTNGTVPLYCRITVDGQEARFGMKCDVNPKYWDVETGKATGRTAEAVKINALVENTKAAVYKVYRELQERDNYVTAEKIKNVFLGIEQKKQTLLELFDRHNREREQLIGINISKSTCCRYCVTRNHLADFILYKYNVHDISIKEINHKFIGDFEVYLIRQDYAKNTIVAMLKKFRHIIELALNEEWIYKNPFKKYKLQWQDGNRGYLTQEEIDKLIDFRFENKRLENACDIFIFCTFTGLAWTDVKHLTKENIQHSVDGKLWIKGRRGKTGTKYEIPLLDIPKMILEKYGKGIPEDVILPVVDMQVYNKRLKEIAKLCGIIKKMSSHLARHTFATLALTRGVSIESVSKMLGHTNISTTQIYAKVTEDKIGNEMNAFAVNIKRRDAKWQPASNEGEMNIDSILRSFKIPAGKVSGALWENLISKVWCKLSDTERQRFVSEVESEENKPNTLHDFYVRLIDYFLENTKSDVSGPAGNVDINTRTQFAVNY